MVDGKTMNKKTKDLILEIIKFFIYSFMIYLFLYHFEAYLTNLVAYQSYLLLMPFTDAYLVQNTIFLPNISLLVLEPCTGVTSISIILGFVLLIEKKLKYYIFGSCFCVLLIYFGNIVRIVIIGILANYFGNGNYIHNAISFVCSPVLAVITILIWSKLRKRL
uniref:Archaeosortase family protein ArtE n=1 Tax=Methanococcus maripaludis (strain C6 / ATCC BAA-1332) TaxID=444158 RepID=A9AAI1_METM6